ncbi:DUF6478 family protein [Limimaricola pyoseonensis]|uniref:Uncharacterized protein n=1 Tax=Limimaricola pyoseonensis TaxID=521013 RepID=A0A1G7F297_9RHOB|nr:DUF6478 family protein [Limimaricola pyoseonensis]SDE69962.1 hypothetical protein SAMN04488567_2391 [Limimaricola pyoseonensis]
MTRPGGVFRRAASRRPEGPPLPHGADWLWQVPLAEVAAARPASGMTLAPGLRLFFEGGDAPEVAPGDGGLAVTPGAGLAYLSLAIDLAPEALRGLSRDHLLRLDLSVRVTAPRSTVRLNLRHGPNVEQVVEALPESGDGAVEFDMWPLPAMVLQADAGWIDLILERPAPGPLLIRELTLSRLPRARF